MDRVRFRRTRQSAPVFQPIPHTGLTARPLIRSRSFAATRLTASAGEPWPLLAGALLANAKAGSGLVPAVLAGYLRHVLAFLRRRCLAGVPSALPVPAVRNVSTIAAMRLGSETRSRWPPW